MSLINNMLKDLENREARPHDVPLIALTNIRQTKRRGIRQQSMTIGLSILAVMVLTTIAMLYLHKTTHLTLPPILTPNSPFIITRQPNDTTWLSPVSITGVTLQVKDNITEVTFLLNHPALYRIDSDEMQNQLSIHLDHADLQAALPPVNYLNTAILQMNTQTIKNETTFTLTYKPGATIKYVNLNDTSTNAELVIAIQDPLNSAMPPATASNLTIKTPVGQNLMQQQYQTALLAAENGQYQSAIQHLSSLLKIDPHFNDARTSLVALLIDQGSTFKANQIIDEGLNENRHYIPFIELKARLLAAKGQKRQALQLLQTASPRLDENPDYHAFLAAMYEQNNHYALAAALYKQLLAQNPTNGNWWFGLGVSLDKLGKNTDAVTAYTKATTEGHLNADSLAYLQNRLQILQENINDSE